MENSETKEILNQTAKDYDLSLYIVQKNLGRAENWLNFYELLEGEIKEVD